MPKMLKSEGPTTELWGTLNAKILQMKYLVMKYSYYYVAFSLVSKSHKLTESTAEGKVAKHFIEVTLWHGCSPVNLLHNFRTLFSKYTSGWLLLLITKE